MSKKVLIIGAGLTGSVIARELAEHNHTVTVWDRRNHIGGNMYDYVDEHGVLVQKYGPHAFHTNDKELIDYISKFESWQPYYLKCGAVWDGKYTSTPFNYDTIRTFYDADEADRLIQKFTKMFEAYETPELSVTEALCHQDSDIREFAKFLFDNDYSLYTAKQWGIEPEEINPSVLARVPIRFSFKDGYFKDKYQVIPEHSYSEFFTNLLKHENIELRCGIQALEHIAINGNDIIIDGEIVNYPIVYTGALDELLGNRYGKLPYRSLKFEWKYSDNESYQNAPVVAYPKAEGYTRITEYKKLPVQECEGTVYALEYPIPYQGEDDVEPYYPVQTQSSVEQYHRYSDDADHIENLYYVGRLADFKYYNMDQALRRALDFSRNIIAQGK